MTAVIWLSPCLCANSSAAHANALLLSVCKRLSLIPFSRFYFPARWFSINLGEKKTHGGRPI